MTRAETVSHPVTPRRRHGVRGCGIDHAIAAVLGGFSAKYDPRLLRPAVSHSEMRRQGTGILAVAAPA